MERKLGRALTGGQGTQSQNHLGKCRVFMFTGPRKAGVPEKVTTPSGKMTVTPDGRAETLERRL